MPRKEIVKVDAAAANPNLSLGTKLSKGSATAKVTLNQKGKRVVQLNKKFTVK